jgi:aspartate/methionine/tyrosine aminotransferase
MEGQDGVFSCIPPQAAAIAFLKYDLPIGSTELANRLIREKSVLIIPGDHFGMDHYIRVSYGLPHDYLNRGLQGIGELIRKIRA